MLSLILMRVLAYTLLYRLLSAVINGTVYRKGTVVICGIEGDTPIFGMITEVIVTPHQECFFVISPLITVAFQHHYYAYEVVPTDSCVSVSMDICLIITPLCVLGQYLEAVVCLFAPISFVLVGCVDCYPCFVCGLALFCDWAPC